MKQVKCVHCDDAISIPEKGEQIVNGETPLEHIERTGHPHVREPRPFSCDDCGNVWPYTGNADRPTCPNCKGKRAEPVDD